jgi:hypothetical protein
VLHVDSVDLVRLDPSGSGDSPESQLLGQAKLNPLVVRSELTLGHVHEHRELWPGSSAQEVSQDMGHLVPTRYSFELRIFFSDLGVVQPRAESAAV